MTCYKGGETVFNNHQFCDVTNRKILDMLPGRPPQVTFSCDKTDATCDFQFWTAQVESFYCALDTCKTEVVPGYDFNTTSYKCEKIKCSCVPGRFICGEDGSVDIGDFLTEEIKGPASFSCKSGAGCKFEEPAMNQLINDIFGDQYISLTCEGGECLHYSQVPGYITPPKPNNTQWIALSVAGAGLTAVLISAVLWYAGRARKSDIGAIRLPDAEVSQLMADHVPATLHFSNISYTLNGRPILEGITGCVRPGQVLAIMGTSGAGKSTFLDILARKRKRGLVGGTTLVNGREVSDADFRNVIGFVDQEDTLMSTLTVYETILYSALLRLPRDMSIEAKKYRTLETMNELGILGIKDSRIGDSGHRSISGGEKRRVSIACELVTSPSILFLDEPTSGLDAYNAFNVVESLVALARNFNRTVVFTIHQPRSNIVALFDQLVLLAQGRLVYAGEFGKCQPYFDSIGQHCPPGFNIADYLIDVTAVVEKEPKGSGNSSIGVISPSGEVTASASLRDEERALLPPRHELLISSGGQSSSSAEEETELQVRRNGDSNSNENGDSFLRRKTSQLLEVVSLSTSHGDSGQQLTPQVASLVDSYAASDIAAGIREDIRAVAQPAQSPEGSDELPDVVVESTLLRGRKRATWATQFRILSGRAFKNMYRDPALLTFQYSASIAAALLCGLFYHRVSDDIGGFQNRLGVFFFTLALFGFSCLSSLGLFANERILFMRERSNGYYSSFTYFTSKILFDILPLRVVPPLLFGGIVYGLVGFVPTVTAFWKFILTLVLFNVTTASVILLISIACANTSVASLIGTMVMLFNLLFTGLLINRSKVKPWLQWLHTVSFFHAAFEALAVNELRFLQLKEDKYGVELDVPAATILSTFGLRAQSFWWPNITLLGIFFVTFTASSFVVLHFFVRERR
jgi:ABC-type multidrug transport system ATPase subunit/ABC-type multidrug transport system permease subunit